VLLHAVDARIEISDPVGAEAVMDAAEAVMDAAEAVMAVDETAAVVMVDAMAADQDGIVRAVRVAMRHPQLPGIQERPDSYRLDLELRPSLHVPLAKSALRSQEANKSPAVGSHGLLAGQRVQANCVWC
jgi:hypothetical protein